MSPQTQGASPPSKLMALPDAVSLVQEGDLLGIGGMTMYRKPMGFIRALARSGVKNLGLLGFTSSFDAELMAAADMLAEIRTCYFGLEYLGLTPLLRRATEQGRIRIIEETEYSIAIGLQASLMRVPYLPSYEADAGTDYFKIRPDFKRAPCPVTGQMLTWFPAVAPRVAVIHAPLCDEQGNAWLGGQYCVDAQMAMAAQTTIVTAERIVSTQEIQAAQGGAGVVSFMVHAVVHLPGGAHPTSCYPDYPVDVVHITRYLRAIRKQQAQAYLDRHVFGCDSPQQYIRRILEDRHVQP